MILILQDLISNDDDQCERSTGAPGYTGVDYKLEQSRTSSWHLGPHEGPAQVKAHDGHPGEHGHDEEVASIADTPTDIVGDIVGIVVNKKEISGEEEN